MRGYLETLACIFPFRSCGISLIPRITPVSVIPPSLSPPSQLSQTNISGSLNQLGSRANHVMFKRALGDEYDALLCLKLICGTYYKQCGS